MPPVFAHGRLRLYLLKLLDEAPRHGYEVIRLLEERFQGLYAPSAGTVYPRLSKLEAEGLVTHATEGGRKVYSITDAGRAELADRSGELADLELEIRDSVTELAAEIRSDVRGAAGDLRREMRAAASASATQVGEDDSWQAAKEELRKARQEWKEQARRAKDESRRAREEAQAARRQAKEAQDRAREEVQRIAGQLQEQFAKSGGVLGSLAGAWLGGTQGPGADRPSDQPSDRASDRAPGWAADLPATGDPARDLDRLLDRFRDQVRDAARDHGVTAARVAEARDHLAAAAARLSGTFGSRP
ncbi:MULTISPECIES: PadR family transcriptional regulator [Streptomyces]|uniref:PadR family transcriptional regulator n=1 Tax=Streptomyces TaxID=1883 RepID=UPI0004BD9311|nr:MULTISPECIES: PadR family transcriptional regulator [Streptomyces]KJY19743.1 PadR family transcriptional regulator [Streptomyces sp. NRRL S-104]KOU66719.1 PadR family transcriptional regulator [Streptomyces sp. IGB124]KOU75495.1 PadR family transcriptional regulator [Streptomyces sp. XY66]